MVTQINVYKLNISTNGTSMIIYCFNYTMWNHLSTSTFGQWESAEASVIIPSASIAQLSKLQHDICIDVLVVCNTAAMISLQQPVRHYLIDMSLYLSAERCRDGWCSYKLLRLVKIIGLFRIVGATKIQWTWKKI